MKTLKIIGAVMSAIVMMFTANTAAQANGAASALKPLGTISGATSGLLQTVRGCHRRIRVHRVPRRGGRRFAHRHVGRNCRPRRVRGVRRGNRSRALRQRDRRRGCITVGPVTYCP